jgi:phosphoglycerate-specific signal transduction histidine kinase
MNIFYTEFAKKLVEIDEKMGWLEKELAEEYQSCAQTLHWGLGMCFHTQKIDKVNEAIRAIEETIAEIRSEHIEKGGAE